jgi:hypothetical protein
VADISKITADAEAKITGKAMSCIDIAKTLKNKVNDHNIKPARR